ncbi:MAG: hypothetical protein ABI609_05640 [Acidobacteriota bacterium]
MSDRFDAELLRWARKPGRVTAEQARASVLVRLAGQERRVARRLWPAIAAAAALLLGLTAGLREPPAVLDSSARRPAAAAHDGVVVLRLSSGTMVFVALPARRAHGVS